MNGQTFIEFRGNIFLFPQNDKITSSEAWLIVYNSNRESIVPLAKLWTCTKNLGCVYDQEFMDKISELKKPIGLAKSSGHS